MNLENFAKMRGLQEAHTSSNSDFVDHLLNGEQGQELKSTVLNKRLQFDCHTELYEEVEQMCSLLHCSKRQFLEMAVCDALSKAEDIFMAAFKEGSGRDFFDVYGVNKEGQKDGNADA